MDERLSQLSLTIDSLTDEQKKMLAKRVRVSEIEMVFSDMREVIAQEAKNRVQSKIALRFNHGYGTGELFNSIYYKIEGDSITISSTKNYFAILNHGIRSFDMKEAFLNGSGRVKMRLPGGAVIFRSVGNPEQKDVRKKKKSPLSKAAWIYPGVSGAHIYEAVNEEMQIWMADYVNTQIRSLLKRAEGREQDVYGISQIGKQYYNIRQNGRFASSNGANTSFSKLLRQDLLKFQYRQGPTGASSPILSRTGKYVGPGEDSYNVKAVPGKNYSTGSAIERMHNQNLGRE